MDDDNKVPQSDKYEINAIFKSFYGLMCHFSLILGLKHPIQLSRDLLNYSFLGISFMIGHYNKIKVKWIDIVKEVHLSVCLSLHLFSIVPQEFLFVARNCNMINTKKWQSDFDSARSCYLILEEGLPTFERFSKNVNQFRSSTSIIYVSSY